MLGHGGNYNSWDLKPFKKENKPYSESSIRCQVEDGGMQEEGQWGGPGHRRDTVQKVPGHLSNIYP